MSLARPCSALRRAAMSINTPMSMLRFARAENISNGGLDYFGRLEEVERRLSQMPGCKIDVVEELVRKARLQMRIDTDRAL